MTTIERPYWPHSDPEPPAALRAVESGWVATPPSVCLNGCHSGSGDARRPVETQGPALICTGKGSCTERLTGWLRAIPDAYALLPAVVDHGTVAGNPENVRVKNPDPPAPMRLEILDLLDQRAERGALGVLRSWCDLVEDQRHLMRWCDCSHARPSHTGHCTMIGCDCRSFTERTVTVYGTVSVLLANLPWATEQDWIGDLYAEIKQLHRQLRDAVGEYRTHPVGTCKAQPPGQGETAVCGGPLFMDREKRAVRCAECGNTQAADSGLRELGLKVGLIGEDGTTTGGRKAAS